MKILILEPYYGGSHRQLVDGMVRHLEEDFLLWSLPARKWKWRMRGAAAVFADRWREEKPEVDLVFASSLMNLAEFRGLIPAEARQIPALLYFHENQLNYPTRNEDPRDYHYGWINILSALSADRVIWNTAFNRDSFLNALPGFVRAMPDHAPRDLSARILDRSHLLPVPLSPDFLDRPMPPEREGLCRILWNHRWEHDKNPEEFFEALYQLDKEGLDFQVSVIGESFREQPPVFEEAKQRLAHRIARWGYLESRGEYLEELERAHLVVSTSLHEFQGLSVLEAAARGALPLLPADLAYPEIWPSTCLYPRGELFPALRERVLKPYPGDGSPLFEITDVFSWPHQVSAWKALLHSFL
ncbi:MAG: DUF3524 domain-containing protein [Candidatus Krumholzibacteria bacterium]|jgi:glycosyltransferase involved in cell wall biosynthesis|nr:DUF3524 domain-containing protein [Candidatus Krumholzibacteria bacterium]MDP7021098.1 DUF3524 domain-containing protein [Candidatus Krumholzibacteria bacterium]